MNEAPERERRKACSAVDGKWKMGSWSIPISHNRSAIFGRGSGPWAGKWFRKTRERKGMASQEIGDGIWKIGDRRGDMEHRVLVLF